MAAPVLVTMGLAFPVQAIAAPEVRLDRRCYSPGEGITQTGSGFTPGAEVFESLTRVRQFPFRGVRPGRWTVYFSATRRLNRRNDFFFFFRLRVRP
jgi:hypothetical protein